MTYTPVLTQIAASLADIHQVLIHLCELNRDANSPTDNSDPTAIRTPSPEQAAVIFPDPDPAPAPAPVFGQPDPNNSAPATGEFVDFTIDTVIHSIDDNGKPVYKGRGYPFTQYGVRIWPEIFGRLGIPIETIALGETTIEPRVVRAVLNETGNPRKIVGYGDEKTQVTPDNNSNNNSAPPPPEPYPDRDIRPQPKDDEIPF